MRIGSRRTCRGARAESWGRRERTALRRGDRGSRAAPAESGLGVSTPLYGEVIEDHAQHPRNRGPLESATASHEGLNPLCGDRVKLELAVKDGLISDAHFTAEACMVAVAAASVVTGLVKGRSAKDAAALSKETLLAELKTTLRPSRVSCATLSLDVLRAALAKL